MGKKSAADRAWVDQTLTELEQDSHHLQQATMKAHTEFEKTGKFALEGEQARAAMIALHMVNLQVLHAIRRNDETKSVFAKDIQEYLKNKNKDKDV